MSDVAVPVVRCDLPGKTLSGTYLQRASEFLSYLLLLGGLATVAAAIYLVVDSYMRAPSFDLWAFVDYWSRRPIPLLSWLWLQHNEHRVLVPKLFLLLDYRAFRGEDIFPLAVIQLVQLALAVTLLSVLRRWEKVGGNEWRTAAGMALFCCFCTAQYPNFICGFQLAFILVGFFVAVAVALLLLSRESNDAGCREWKRISLAMLAAMAATYSAANGVLVWPILLAVAILQRSRRVIVAVVAFTAGLTLTSYFYHHASLYSGSLFPVHHPVGNLTYIAAYLGAPWSSAHHLGVAVLFGATAIAGAALVVPLVLARPERKPSLLLFSAMLVFTIGSAAMTSLGRLPLGVRQAFSERYQTISLLFWLVLGLVLILFVRRSRVRLLALQTLLLVIMLVASIRVRSAFSSALSTALSVNTGSLALITGVHDPAGLSMLFLDPNIPWADMPVLKLHHVSVFATRLSSNLRKPVQSVYRMRKQGCWGAVNQVTPIPMGRYEGIRAGGWAWDPVRRRGVGRIVFVARGNIVGFAETGYLRSDIKNRVGARSAEYAGWEGYVEPLPARTTILLYAVANWSGSEVCRVDHAATAGLATSTPVQFSVNGILN